MSAEIKRSRDAGSGGGGGGANTALSNLTSPTSVNQSLIPGNANIDLGSASDPMRSVYASASFRVVAGGQSKVVMDDGLSTPSGANPDGSVRSGDAQSSMGLFTINNAFPATSSGTLFVETGNKTGTGAGQSGDIALKTGNVTSGTATGPSGGITLETGTNAGSGARGEIIFADGSEGTSGDVWTSTGTGGEGAWQTLTAGDVTGPASSTANLVPVFSDGTGKAITTSGVSIISSRLVTTTGTAGSPALRMNSTTSGLYRSSASGTGISAAGTEVFRFENAGHVSSKLIEPSTDLSGSLTLGSPSKRWWFVYTNGTQLNSLTADSGTMDLNYNTITHNPSNARKEQSSIEVSTVDATVTTFLSRAISNSTTYAVVAKVTAKRTGGAAGTDGDSAYYYKTATVKVNSVGAITTSAVTAIAEVEDQPGWDLTIDDDGSANLRVRITGAASNNIDWKGEVEVFIN